MDIDVQKLAKIIADNLQGYTNTFPDVPVGVSARHIHLSKEHMEILFGWGYQLTKKTVLMGGQYACEEVVTIIGKNLSAIENVRVLGPLRNETQVEVSQTDNIKLRLEAPLRDSGDINNSAPIAIAGPKGVVYLKHGCIVAARHIHMSPNDAAVFKLKDGDMVSTRFNTKRGLTFNNVKIRVHDSFTLEMHIDTDEANACGIYKGQMAQII